MIQEGIEYSNSKFKFDFGQNHPTDIINFRKLIAQKSDIHGNVYFYGYAFRKDVSSSVRTNFIHALKLYTDEISEQDRKKFINFAVGQFVAAAKIGHIDAIIYPKSERTDLNKRLVHEIARAIYTDNYLTFELIKNIPKNITFDYNAFKEDKGVIDKNMHKAIEQLLDKIHSLDYFSIAENVKPKYRPYIQQFLKFKNKEDEHAFESIQKPLVLLVDDINTSFSTLQEIIRIIRKVNPESKILAFTLIGKNFN